MPGHTAGPQRTCLLCARPLGRPPPHSSRSTRARASERGRGHPLSSSPSATSPVWQVRLDANWSWSLMQACWTDWAQCCLNKCTIHISTSLPSFHPAHQPCILCAPTAGGGAGEPASRSLPPPAGVGVWLSAKDLDATAAALRSFTMRLLLPRMEERAAKLNAAVSDNGWRSKACHLFGPYSLFVWFLCLPSHVKQKPEPSTCPS